jgi:hypothetical protein
MGAFERTKAAVDAWDVGREARAARFEAATTAEEVAAAEAAEAAELRAFHEAFYEDTKEVNAREAALLVHPDDPWLRGLLARQS